MRFRDPQTGRYTSMGNILGIDLGHIGSGERTRGFDLEASILFVILNLLGEILQKAFGIQFIDITSIINLATLILFLALISEILDQGIFFVIGYWVLSYLFLTTNLISVAEAVLNLFLPLTVLSFSYYAKSNGQSKFWGYFCIAVIILWILAFLIFGNDNSSAINNILNATTTSIATISTTSIASITISSTTSATTTIIQTQTGCEVNDLPQPFNCSNNPVLHNGTLSFNLNQTSPDTLYDVSLACVPSGYKGPISGYMLYSLDLNGTLSKSSYGANMAYGTSIDMHGLPCINVENNNTSFNGTVQVYYLGFPPPPSQANMWFNETLGVYVNVTEH